MYPVSLGPGSPPPVGPAEVEDDDEDDEDDDDLPRILTKAEETPDKDNWYRPGQPVPGSQTNKAQPVPGSQINPAQPAPQPDAEADDSLDDGDAVQDACGAASDDDLGGSSVLEAGSTPSAPAAPIAPQAGRPAEPVFNEEEFWKAVETFIGDPKAVQAMKNDKDVQNIIAYLKKTKARLAVKPWFPDPEKDPRPSYPLGEFDPDTGTLRLNMALQEQKTTGERFKVVMHELIHACAPSPRNDKGSGTSPRRSHGSPTRNEEDDRRGGPSRVGHHSSSGTQPWRQSTAEPC